MNWRAILTLTLLIAAIFSGWSLWKQHRHERPSVARSDRPDYVLRDFEVVSLDEHGKAAFTLRAPQLKRRPDDKTMTLQTPLFFFPDKQGAYWQVRSQDECYAALAAAGIPARPALAPARIPMPSPVVVTGPVGGVHFRMIRPEDEPLVISCELAARLPALAEIVRARGVRAVDVLSAHRASPLQSFHRMGLGLDLFAFERDGQGAGGIARRRRGRGFEPCCLNWPAGCTSWDGCRRCSATSPSAPSWAR